MRSASPSGCTETRKGNDIPYVAHLLAVAATVLEWGGDEDTAIAALLHDAVEDQGGLETARRIRERFGDRVADLVRACSDSVSADRADMGPWEARKCAYIAKLAGADRSAALIAAADTLHNLTSLIRDLRADGRDTLTRFAVPDRLLWYFTSVIEALAPHKDATPTRTTGARRRVRGVARRLGLRKRLRTAERRHERTLVPRPIADSSPSPSGPVPGPTNMRGADPGRRLGMFACGICPPQASPSHPAARQSGATDSPARSGA
jgi:predicted HD phosphohydrolase